MKRFGDSLFLCECCLIVTIDDIEYFLLLYIEYILDLC